jgi:hypothetical protein
VCPHFSQLEQFAFQHSFVWQGHLPHSSANQHSPGLKGHCGEYFHSRLVKDKAAVDAELAATSGQLEQRSAALAQARSQAGEGVSRLGNLCCIANSALCQTCHVQARPNEPWAWCSVLIPPTPRQPGPSAACCCRVINLPGGITTVM